MTRIGLVAVMAMFLSTAGLSTLKAQGPPPRKAYESRCGSEIAWLSDFDEASRQAAAEKKPVFWFVPGSYGSRMDRRQEVYWATMGGAFMDEAFIKLINARFVPLKLGLSKVLKRNKDEALPPREKRKEWAETYGLKHLEFIEPGFVLLDPAMKLVHTMDAQSSYNSRWMLSRMERVLAKNPGLGGPIKDSEKARIEGPKLLLEAHRLLRAGEFYDALSAFDAKGLKDSAEARYFAGACLHRMQRNKDGDAAWRDLVKNKPDDRWAWKAKLELERWGPFMRGLEYYRDFSDRAMASKDLRRSQLGGSAQDEPAMTRSAIDILLRNQREDGSWNDSIYDFGGIDSLPNVHVAVTAIAALALLEWREVDEKQIDQALARALPFLLDEKNTNPDDRDELIWAHVYRLQFLSQYLKIDEENTDKVKKKIGEIVRLTQKLRGKNGAWRHEYAAAFTTASVVHALLVADEAGAKINRGMLKSTGKALAKTRGENGAFSYGFSSRTGRLESSAGRMPLCEMALLLCEQSDQKRLEAAIETSFEKHELLEAVRKYDDHSDRYGNGGFFFWYDMHGRSLAIDKIESGAKKSAWKKKMKEIIRDIHEADGGWIDSHEVGKSYGTAMGLITLKLNSEAKN